MSNAKVSHTTVVLTFCVLKILTKILILSLSFYITASLPFMCATDNFYSFILVTHERDSLSRVVVMVDSEKVTFQLHGEG